ncbi:MAG: hypothetical protein RLZZ618_806 [Pseudomonadota bacterium]|jgi:hypothetical protein
MSSIQANQCSFSDYAELPSYDDDVAVAETEVEADRADWGPAADAEVSHDIDTNDTVPRNWESAPEFQPVSESTFPDSPFSPIAAATTGAMGREATVQSLMGRAYEAGHIAPQEPFSGSLFRSVGQTAFEPTIFDHTYSNPGRYNATSERLLYGSPDLKSAALEAAAYADGPEPLANRSMLEARFTATPDAEGRGGVANLRAGLAEVGLPVEALIDPKGIKAPGLLYQLTGEHPYTLGQQAGKGAADAGASGMRAPAATGAGDQINVITRNANASQLTPEQLVRYDANGRGTTQPSAAHVNPMPVDPSVAADGPLSRPAGGAAANQTTVKLSAEPLTRALQQANGATEGYPRANSGRYGAVGGAAISLGSDALAAVRGEQVDLASSAQAAGTNATIGYGAARAADTLTPRIGLRGAGGAVAGVIEGAISTGTNAQAYRRGEVSAARATANIAVDTGTAVGAGAAGAAIGAAVGSVVPVAGTAVGAVVGFAAGAGTYAVVKFVGERSGAINAAKDRLTQTFASAEKPLGAALTKVGQGLDTVSAKASQAWSAVKFW